MFPLCKFISADGSFELRLLVTRVRAYPDDLSK